MKQADMKKCLAVIIIAMVLTGCRGGGSPQVQGEKAKIYASFGLVQDLTQKIAGDGMDVAAIVYGGAEPHDWEPTPGEMAEIAKGEIIFYIGMGLEGWIDSLKILAKEADFVEVSQEVELLEGQADPHIWLNPLNAKTMMENIKEGLSVKYPEKKEIFEKNFNKYAQQAEELYEDYQNLLVGAKSKDLVVSHGAYGYLCQAFGLNQIALEGLSSDSEPTAAQLAEVIEYITKNHIQYVFVEETGAAKSMDIVAQETGAEKIALNDLEYLDPESGEDYFSVMTRNLDALGKGLGVK